LKRTHLNKFAQKQSIILDFLSDDTANLKCKENKLKIFFFFFKRKYLTLILLLITADCQITKHFFLDTFVTPTQELLDHMQYRWKHGYFKIYTYFESLSMVSYIKRGTHAKG
jgi:hypothetical protein